MFRVPSVNLSLGDRDNFLGQVTEFRELVSGSAFGLGHCFLIGWTFEYLNMIPASTSVGAMKTELDWSASSTLKSTEKAEFVRSVRGNQAIDIPLIQFPYGRNIKRDSRLVWIHRSKAMKDSLLGMLAMNFQHACPIINCCVEGGIFAPVCNSKINYRSLCDIYGILNGDISDKLKPRSILSLCVFKTLALNLSRSLRSCGLAKINPCLKEKYRGEQYVEEDTEEYLPAIKPPHKSIWFLPSYHEGFFIFVCLICSGVFLLTLVFGLDKLCLGKVAIGVVSLFVSGFFVWLSILSIGRSCEIYFGHPSPYVTPSATSQATDRGHHRPPQQ